jgi:uncharacterized protein with ATP-grasp and redox domains
MSKEEKQLSKLREEYNFKKEKDDSWSFEYNKKKAFIINLTDPRNIKVITPFVIRRKQLTTISATLFENLENEIFNRSDLIEFTKFSIEVIGNLLDKSKMGSTEYYLNMLYQDIKTNDDHFMFLSTMSDIISMIDYSTEYHFSKFSEEKMKSIHTAYFKFVIHGNNEEYMINNDGLIQLLTRVEGDVDPQDEYNLAEMIPINREEI